MTDHEPKDTSAVEPIVRGLTSAAKSLRLYPASSPIPRQSVESAAASLMSFLAEEPELTLRVARDGLAYAGRTVAPGMPGAVEIAEALRGHGAAEVTFQPGAGVDDLLVFLQAVLEKPADLADRGGLTGVLSAGGVASVAVTEVELHVAETGFAGTGDEDIDAFLREVASDPEHLAAWLTAAAHGDPAVLESGLGDFARAAGPEGLQLLSASLAGAFTGQDADGRDAVMGLALEKGNTRDLLGSVFAQIASRDMASSLAEGTYGNNMLSMSSALTRLPLAEKMGDVLAQVKDILPEMGKSAKEMQFLDHMLQVRGSETPETSLVDAIPTYQQIAQLADVDAEQIEGARNSVVTSAGRSDDSAVVTMLTLLDQERDAALYQRTFEGLAGLIPHLLERGRLDLAVNIMRELETREARAESTWPQIAPNVHAAVESAITEGAARALLTAAATNPEAAHGARDLMHHAGDAAMGAFVQQALATRPNGLDVAESIVGRRLIDMLVAFAAKAPAGQVAPLVARLGREGEPRPQQAVESILKRPDELARREAAAGLGASRGPVALRHLTMLLKDTCEEVATAAIRGVGRSDAPGAAAALDARLDELDIDGKDFSVAREIIGALARVPDAQATEILKDLAGRRAFIKRGHFAEVNALAKQALEQRESGGASR